jgi:hypothetical protein
MKKRRLKTPLPLWFVVFRDCTQQTSGEGGWHIVEDYELPNVDLCVAVGFIIKETRHELAIAQVISQAHKEWKTQVHGVFCIPKGAIVSKRKL